MRTELQHGIVFTVCLLGVLSFWGLAGASADALAMRKDALNAFLQGYVLISEFEGDWWALAYRPELFGGTNLLATHGMMPLAIVLSKFGVEPVANLNICLVVLQALLACLCVCGACALAGIREWRPRHALLIACIGVMAAFSPNLAFRIEAGHLNLLAGIVAVQALLTIWLCCARKQMTVTIFVLAVFALVNALCLQSFQILLYAIVFGAPLVVALHVGLTRRPLSLAGLSPLVFTTLVGCGAVLMALPILAEMLLMTFGTDASRSASQDVFALSPTVSSWRDWLVSLTWFDFGWSTRPAHLQHEYNHGLGPPILLAGVLFFRSSLQPNVQWERPGWRFAVAAALGISVLLCILFSLKSAPVQWLVERVPMLGAFRVPERAMMPVLTIWYTLVLGAILGVTRVHREVLSWRPDLIGTLGLVVVAMLSGQLVQEALMWLSSMGLLLCVALRRVSGILPLLVTMASISLIQFSGHVEVAPGAGRNIEENYRLGEIIRNREPRLESPLERADINILELGLYTGSVGKISSINGYGFPHQNFSSNFQHASGRDFVPVTTFFNLSPADEGFEILQQLYNVCCSVAFRDGGLVVSDLADTPGAAWASDRRIGAEDNIQMLMALSTNNANDANSDNSAANTGAHPENAGWHHTQYVVGSTEQVFPASCRGLDMVLDQYDRRLMTAGFTVSAALEATCPITISMTFTEALEVRARGDHGEVLLDTFPAYGSLLGFDVPGGTREITVRNRLRAWPYTEMASVVGLVIVIVLGAGGFRRYSGDRLSIRP